MSPTQENLLWRLIAADREYRILVASKRVVSNDRRGVEVGSINSVDPRTAKTLEDAGLAESVEMHGHNYSFLGSYEPYKVL